MIINSITVSTNNSKLGIIPNLSLSPVKSCVSGAPCKKSCYAVRLCGRYPNARKAYEKNLKVLKNNSLEFFTNIHSYLKCFSPRFFRAHSSGDFQIGDNIESQDYVNGWFEIARQYPEIKFLAFTKCYHLDFSNAPENFAIIFSAWFDYPMPEILPPGVRGIAWVQNADGYENRIPADALACSGKCDECFQCWDMAQGENVVLPLH